MQIIQEWIDSADILVLFNAKFDLHWLRRYGIRFHHKRIWDVQLAHFIMVGQSEQYPSLNSVSEYHGLGQKIDYIQENYWSKRIDTNEIPLSDLNPYLEQDLLLTRDCYKEQLACVTEKQKKLIGLDCEDLLVLEEIEWNGLIYDVEQSTIEGQKLRDHIAELDAELQALTGAEINFNSDPQLSALLYGGRLKKQRRVPDGIYKSGKQAGQPKHRWEEYFVEYPQLVKPLKGTGLQAEGVYSTSEPILRQLNATGKAREVIELLLRRSELEKLCSGYYEGLPKLIREMGWERNTLHGTLNQCVAATGRLSSSKPNLQNNDKKVEKLFRSRYE